MPTSSPANSNVLGPVLPLAGAPSGTELPDLLARVAFATAPLATPTWTNLDASKLLGFVSERGRGSELEEFQPGTATVTLDNRDRSYDPSNTSGAYFGNLKRRKRFSLRATVNAVTYDVFDMHVKHWPQVWEGMMGRSDVPLTDAFEMFQGMTFSTGLDANLERLERAEERSDQRIAWILDQIGWPAERRILNVGEVRIKAHPYDAMNALQNMRNIEEAEKGFAFMDAAGNFVFHDKYKRLRDFASSQGTFSDAPTGSELPLTAFELDHDVPIFNDVNGKKAEVVGARSFGFSDSTSITDYGRFAKTVELWASADTQAEARAHHFVVRYAQPTDRIKSITIEPQMDEALWPHALGRLIGERITVKLRFYGKGSLWTQESRIEGIRHEYTAEPLRWRTTFRLSPLFTQELQGFWRLGTAGKSELGSTTRLAF